MPAERMDLSSLLAGWGVQPADLLQRAGEQAVEFAAAAGVEVEVFSARFGVLTLSCSQLGASRLLPLLPELSQVVARASDGALSVRLRPSASFSKGDHV